jgi:hypothetical protein
LKRTCERKTDFDILEQFPNIHTLELNSELKSMGSEEHNFKNLRNLSLKNSYDLLDFENYFKQIKSLTLETVRIDEIH